MCKNASILFVDFAKRRPQDFKESDTFSSNPPFWKRARHFSTKCFRSRVNQQNLNLLGGCQCLLRYRRMGIIECFAAELTVTALIFWWLKTPKVSWWNKLSPSSKRLKPQTLIPSRVIRYSTTLGVYKQINTFLIYSISQWGFAFILERLNTLQTAVPPSCFSDQSEPE